MNMNAVRKRVEALERLAAIHNGDYKDDDILSPRDVCFLITEQRRIEDENTLEGKVLVSRIDDILQRHQRALKGRRHGVPDPAEAHALMVEAFHRDEYVNNLSAEERQEVRAENEHFRREWLERLGAEREYIREVIKTLDSLRQ